MFLVNEKVFWFEISVDDGERVEVLQGRDNLRCIELSRAHRELAGVSEVTEQLPTADEGEEHVETVGVLVAPQEGHDEGMSDLSEVNRERQTQCEFSV